MYIYIYTHSDMFCVLAQGEAFRTRVVLVGGGARHRATASCGIACGTEGRKNFVNVRVYVWLRVWGFGFASSGIELSRCRGQLGRFRMLECLLRCSFSRLKLIVIAMNPTSPALKALGGKGIEFLWKTDRVSCCIPPSPLLPSVDSPMEPPRSFTSHCRVWGGGTIP